MELVVVVTLCALLCSMGLYVHTLLKTTSRKADLALLRLALRSMAYKAVATAQTCIARCVGTHALMFDGREYTYSDNLVLGVLPGIYGPPSHPQRLVTQPVTYQNSAIICYPEGTIQPGTLYFTDAARTQQYALTTPVSAFSYIRLYDYSHGKWHAAPA